MGVCKDLTGMQFGRLTAKKIVGKGTRSQGTLWYCECSCGGDKVVPARYLLSCHTRSCGCINREIKENSIKKGDRWGRLEAVKFVCYDTPERGYQAIWLFKCDCGSLKEIPVTDVKFGGTRSCGCKFIEHISNLNREDITNQTFGRLKAIRPTEKRSKSGSIIWELKCECGNLEYKTVNELKTGRVLSCGCLYNESRTELMKYRKDFVKNTSLSNIVATKKPIKTNTTGHTGVWSNKKTGGYEAYIYYQKKRYNLGTHKNIDDAIRARKEAERRLHDPVIMEYFANLTPDKKREFVEYLKSIGAAVPLTEGKESQK